MWNIGVVPPVEGIGAEIFQQAEERKEGGDPDNEIDQLPELRACVESMEGQVENYQIVEQQHHGPEASWSVHGKSRREQAEDKKTDPSPAQTAKIFSAINNFHYFTDIIDTRY